MSCVCVDWLLAGSTPILLQPADINAWHIPFAENTVLPDDKQQACLKRVEAINWNKLKVNGASCWTYYTDKGKGQVHPRTGHKGPKGEWRYSATLSWTSVLGEVAWSTPRMLYPWEDPVPTVLVAGWAPGQFWTGAENLTHTRIRSLDHPAHKKSLYQLSYPSPPSYTDTE
jgi:hypothetical protein